MMSKSRSPFPSTKWTLVACAAGQEATDEYKTAALGDLFSIYSPALCAHAVARLQMTPDRAEDLVQSFFAEKVLEKNLLASADRKKGRFRNFLLKVFSNFVRSQARREMAEKRGPSQSKRISIDDDPDIVSCDAGIDSGYNLAWARQIISEALRKMQKECEIKSRNDLWEVFSCRILKAMMEQEEPESYDDLVARFGFHSPTQAFNALITAKRMFRRALEEVVRDTVASDDLVASEIRDLRMILSSARAGSD